MGVVATIGAAVTAVAAEVGVAVTATALTVGFETIAAVGAVLGVVGQVTHVKALSFAGLALGAVGGIGAFASSAGLLGSGAVDLGAGATAGTDAASSGVVESVASGGVVDNTSTFTQAASEGATSAAPDVTGAASGAGGFIDNTSTFAQGAGGVGFSDVAGAVKPVIQAADSANAPAGNDHATGNDASAAGTSGGFNSGKDLIAANGSVTLPPNPPAGTPTTVAATTSQPGPAPEVGGNGAFKLGPGPGAVPGNAPGTDAGGIGGAFGKLVDYVGQHPVVGLGALQAGGSLLTGAFSTLTPAQVALANAQASANDAAAAQQRLQTNNLQMPKAVASSVPVSGQAQLVPSPTTPPPPVAVPGGPAGFINQNPVPSQQITGVAA
jgi:hypothetical protein